MTTAEGPPHRRAAGLLTCRQAPGGTRARPARAARQRVAADARERGQHAADRRPHPAVGPPAGRPAVLGLDAGQDGESRRTLVTLGRGRHRDPRHQRLGQRAVHRRRAADVLGVDPHLGAHRQAQVGRREVSDRQPDVVRARQRVVGPRLRPGAHRAQRAGQLHRGGVLPRPCSSAPRTGRPGGAAARRTRRPARSAAGVRVRQLHRRLDGGALSGVRGERPVQVVARGRRSRWPAWPWLDRGRRTEGRARLGRRANSSLRARSATARSRPPRRPGEQPAAATSSGRGAQHACGPHQLVLQTATRQRDSQPQSRPARKPVEDQRAEQPPAAAEAEGGHVGARRRAVHHVDGQLERQARRGLHTGGRREGVG